jgi:DNA invertase Pin-like site-specific DNA recombinase
MKEPTPAYGYLRVSGASQVEGDGFPRQRDAIEAYAAAHGFYIIRWFEECGVSGTLIDRPALSEMVLAIDSGVVRTIIIEKLDRLARDLMVQETIIQGLVKQECTLLSTAGGEEDLCDADPGRKLMRQIMGAFAEYEKQKIVLKLRAARDRKRIATGHCEGRHAFVNESATARAEALSADGLTLVAIAKALDSEGYRTNDGKKWWPMTVRRLLKPKGRAR